MNLFNRRKLHKNVNKALEAFKPKDWKHLKSYSVEPEILSMNFKTNVWMCLARHAYDSPISCIEIIIDKTLKNYVVKPIKDR